ncbi:hypothetical protein FRC17_003417 [Serendipita sp. 399]|nr:hypothetical protein FRC17_003417 [Serendipita sp. 399]
MSRQPKLLNVAYKTLQAAAKSCGNDEASNLMRELASLITTIKPGDAVVDATVSTFGDMFENKLELLYRLLPSETTRFVVAYFSSLLTQFKSADSGWLHTAGSSLAIGLDAYALESEEGRAEFNKEFLSDLCDFLLDRDVSNKSINLRYTIGMLLSNLISAQPQVKSILLDPNVLGTGGLTRLFLGSKEFRTTDPYLQMITRLAPPKKEEASRVAYYSTVLCTSASKLMFKPNRTKKLVELINRSGNKAWFERSDPLHAEIGVISQRSQRLVAQAIFFNGEKYSSKDAVLRVYLDSELENEEQLMTSSFANICAINEIQVDDATMITFELNSPLTTHVDIENAPPASSTVLGVQLTRGEGERFRKIAEWKGLVGSILKAMKVIELLTSGSHVVVGSPALPPNQNAPLPLKRAPGGTRHLNTRYDTGSDSELSSTDDYVPPTRAVGKSQVKRKVKAVISDSDEEQVTNPRKAIPLSKRKLVDVDDSDSLTSPPSLKRARISKEGEESPSHSSTNPSLPEFVLVEEGPFSPSSSTPAQEPVVHPAEQARSSKPDLQKGGYQNEEVLHIDATSSLLSDQVIIQPQIDTGLPVNEDEVTVEPNYIGNSDITVPLDIVEQNVPTVQAQLNIAAKSGKAIWELDDFTDRAAQALRNPRSQPEDADGAINVRMAESVQKGNQLTENTLNQMHNEHTTVEMNTRRQYPDSPEPPSSPIRSALALRQRLRTTLVLTNISPELVKKAAPRTDFSREYQAPSHPAATRSKIGDQKSAQDTQGDLASKRTGALITATAEAASSVIKSERKANPSNVSTTQDGVPPKQSAMLDEEQFPSRKAMERGKADPTRRFVRWKSVHYPKFEESKSVLKLKKSQTGRNDNNNNLPQNSRNFIPPEASDSDTLSDDELPTVSISEIDAIAEVLTAIQQVARLVIIENVGKKVSAVRTEARVARARMVEVAVGDLGAMHESLEVFLNRFFGLDEEYEAIDQAVRVAREKLQGANEEVQNILSNIIKEHDRMVRDMAAYQVPLLQPPPKCVNI